LSVDLTTGLRLLHSTVYVVASDLLPHMSHLTRQEVTTTTLSCNNTHVFDKMTSPTPKGKEKEADVPEIELTEAQRLKRSFERSLAGPSVGKAGLIRDQTGKSGFGRQC
jgi:hypothetical protein